MRAWGRVRGGRLLCLLALLCSPAAARAADPEPPAEPAPAAQEAPATPATQPAPEDAVPGPPAAVPANPAQAGQDHFDPLRGIDENGRIPRGLRPPDLPNPEHWRYIPEGRLKPGNLFQRLLVSSVIAPFVFHDSDVGTGFGAALVDIDFREQRRRETAGAFLSYTTEGQQNYTFFWRRWLHHVELPTGGVLQEERSFVRAAGGYSRTLTRRFFGLGSSSNKHDETSYRDEFFYLELGMDHALPDPGDPFVLSLGARAESHSLGPGHVSGDPSMGKVDQGFYHGLFNRADDSLQGSLSGGVRWDTRDSQMNPYRGWSVGADVDAALLQDSWRVGALWGVGATKLFPLPPLLHSGGDPGEENPPTDVLALGFRGQTVTGELPFFAYPSLGGSESQRGFIAGRWRDRTSYDASLEYRFWILPRGFPIPFTRAIRVERVGAALFYEAGAVGHDPAQVVDSRVRSSYGVGLRFSLERAAPFRVDVGFSEDGVNVAARFGLSF